MSPRPIPTPLSIGDALFGKTRQAVLGLLFGRAGRSYHVREIVAVTGYGSAQVQRELARLVECGLVTRTPRGKRVLYKVNRESHACEDVTHLVVGTFGMADLLRAALSPVADRIDLAMIVGPAARGEYVGLPDVELLVVCMSSAAGGPGRLEAADLAPILRNAERAIARRIALTLLDRATFAIRRRQRKLLPGSLSTQRQLVLISRFDEKGNSRNDPVVPAKARTPRLSRNDFVVPAKAGTQRLSRDDFVVPAKAGTQRLFGAP